MVCRDIWCQHFFGLWSDVTFVVQIHTIRRNAWWLCRPCDLLFNALMTVFPAQLTIKLWYLCTFILLERGNSLILVTLWSPRTTILGLLFLGFCACTNWVLPFHNMYNPLHTIPTYASYSTTTLHHLYIWVCGDGTCYLIALYLSHSCACGKYVAHSL